MELDNPFKLIYDQLLILTKKVDGLRSSPEEPLENDITDAMGASKILNCKKGTIYNLVHKNIVPHHKKGRKLYFFKSELIEYIRAGKVKSGSEIETEVNQRLSDIDEGAQRSQKPQNTADKERFKDTDYSLSDKVKATTISALEQKEDLEEATEETVTLHYLQNESELDKES